MTIPEKKRMNMSSGGMITTVRELCERYRLSQTALAKRFGIPLRTVQAWHIGERIPPDYVIRMMAQLLELDSE